MSLSRLHSCIYSTSQGSGFPCTRLHLKAEAWRRNPRMLRSQLRRTGLRNASSQSSGKYVQEHDYTITPTTYAYTTEGNKELFERFPLVNAKSLARRRERPRKVRMLAREFIDDSMYNPHYGYFSKSAEIFTVKDKFKVDKMGNMDTFIDHWALEYRKQQQNTRTAASDEQMGTQRVAQKIPQDEQKNLRRTKVSRQLWHTPSELFTPYYGQALARYIVNQHLQQSSREDDLVIYETGAGNGTLMLDILNFLEKEYPDIYARTRYNVIEISTSLSLKQRMHAEGHSERVTIHNCSIFDWKETQPDNCFFIALEVWDNLSHDVIRYDNTTGTPYQGYTVVDPNGDFTEVYSPKLDKLAAEFLEIRSKMDFKPDNKLGWHPLSQPKPWRYLRNAILPFQGNLSGPEYIPTKYFQLLQILSAHFPKHKILASDFTHFPGCIRGYGSPVVQTFMEDTPVTASTYMVLQGYFDIMFPTDFRLAQRLYEHVMQRPAAVASHRAFLAKWTDPSESATKTGENPMLSFYRNAAFLYSPSPDT